MNTFKKTSLYILALVTSVILYGCSASPDYGNYKILLSNQMQEMMNVLNAGHRSEFMTKYVSPSYIKSEGGVNQALLRFDNKKQQQLYDALKIAKNISPLYDENANTLTYISTSLSKPLTFKLTNSKWYLQGDWFM